MQQKKRTSKSTANINIKVHTKVYKRIQSLKSDASLHNEQGGWFEEKLERRG